MPLGTIQRMNKERDGAPCLPFIEHRSREKMVLFPDVEWGWSEDPREAYVFPMRDLPLVKGHDDYERSAQFHVNALIEGGEKRMLVICTYGEAGAQERALRRASSLAQVEASVAEVERTPQEVYAETARRLGEHES